MFELEIVVLLAIFVFVGGFGFGVSHGMNLVKKTIKEEFNKVLHKEIG